MQFLAALQFLTIFPIKRDFSAEQMGRSTAWFPLIGLLIGLILAGFSYLLGWLLPRSLVNIILVALLALCSGALHLDGLADTFDGIAGHRTRERRLEIMRDSRIGGFGATGLALFLIFEYAALNSLPQSWVIWVLILAPTLSRWAMVMAIFVYPYARDQGLGSPFKSTMRWYHLTIATIIALAVSAATFRIAGIAVVLAVCGVTFLLAGFLVRKLGGLTGDTYGAINELTTLTVLVIASMLVFKHWLV
ncbi:MAG: adenosylcobinamide-GDP ribazoletransferase [Dehalococcoidales bacterium]|nr:adenosylcobinamide-GDP ribazoletransferase [Dehalococcoidales bacterium]